MIVVKTSALAPLPEEVEPHVAVLAERLMQLVRQSLLAEDWGGLRIVHFRVLSCVPVNGTTITELAVPLSMTKQAVGQFVTQLQHTGHLRVQTDEQDRRRRLVVRTSLGTRTVAAVNSSVAALEERWAERIGRERYAEFRAVLEELALT